MGGRTARAGGNAPTRVLVVDDHALVREAIARALAGSEMHVVAQASSAQQALDRLAEAKPDLILLDIDLRGTSGIEVLPEIRRRAPAAIVIMLTVSADDDDVDEAVRNGASGYLTKDMSSDALLRAVRGAADGDLAMSRQMAQKLVLRYASTSKRAPESSAALDALTPREREILRMLGDGMTSREIGEVLVVSARTVEGHVGRILNKLGVRNRVEAVRLYRPS